jgi:hypothetical protein
MTRFNESTNRVDCRVIPRTATRFPNAELAPCWLLHAAFAVVAMTIFSRIGG